MFAQLPAPLQQKIVLLLNTNNFPEAKALLDQWLSRHANA